MPSARREWPNENGVWPNALVLPAAISPAAMHRGTSNLLQKLDNTAASGTHTTTSACADRRRSQMELERSICSERVGNNPTSASYRCLGGDLANLRQTSGTQCDGASAHSRPAACPFDCPHEPATAWDVRHVIGSGCPPIGSPPSSVILVVSRRFPSTACTRPPHAVAPRGSAQATGPLPPSALPRPHVHTWIWEPEGGRQAGTCLREPRT